MGENELLAARFDACRDHLRAVAYRMLGSLNEADDAVQESWLRLSRSGSGEVRDLRAWLTTVVARVCLDLLRARRLQRERVPLQLPEVLAPSQTSDDPEHQVELADAVGAALLVVLERLPPAERVAFVLHDMFDLPFDKIGAIVERSTSTARQLASRGRRRIKGWEQLPNAAVMRQKRIGDAFLAASRTGNLDALLAVLDPEVSLRAGGAKGEPIEVHGAPNVARGAMAYAARSHLAQSALVDGSAGIVLLHDGRVAVALKLEIEAEKITRIEVISDRTQLKKLDVVLFAAAG
jgi:RNA polymerase sigma-70 factor (ECF subfamily)